MIIFLLEEGEWKLFDSKEKIFKKELKKRNILIGDRASIGNRASIGVGASIGDRDSIGNRDSI